MKHDLNWMGYACGFYRTLGLGIIILWFLTSIRNFEYRGLSFIMPDIIIISVSLAVITYTWICALMGGPFRAIQKFCSQSNNPKEMLTKLESIWDGCTLQAPSCRIDGEYFIWAKKLHSGVLRLDEIYGIRYTQGYAWFSGDLWIYLKDNTCIRLKMREGQGRSIENHIRLNITGIMVGDEAVSLLLRTLVGKINNRYQVVRIRDRFFIIDFANPARLRSYLSLGDKYRFSESGTKSSLRAWELSREELQAMKNSAYKSSSTSTTVIGNIAIGGGLLGTFFLINHPISDALPIQSLVGGQFWVLALILIGLFLLCFLLTNLDSRFKTKKYIEFRISRKKASYTKMQLFLYIVARVSAFAVLLYFIVMMFVWNVGLLPYALFVFVLIVYIFLGAWAGYPDIDPKSTVSILYKKVKSKEKRRIIKWKKSYR